jgi:hypothetical protein
MQYDINTKNIKQSASNLSNFFKEKNIDIPKSTILEAISKVFFFRNWNTLEGLSTKPQIIQHLKENKSYLIEIECSLTKNDLLSLIKKSFLKANAHFQLDNFIHENNYSHVNINLTKSTDNFLTAMFILCENIKPYDVKKFEFIRIIQEKESMMSYFEKKVSIPNYKIK